MDDAIQEQEPRSPQIGAGPWATSTPGRIGLDRQADPEHEREQPEEFAVGDLLEERLDLLLPGRGAGGGWGCEVADKALWVAEDPDVGSERSEDCDASGDIELRDACGHGASLVVLVCHGCDT
ncbi:hypothetical protein GCM10009702_08880 [Propioniferax innocua]